MLPLPPLTLCVCLARYVCAQSSSEIQAARALKQKQPPSPWRDTDVQQNLDRFQRMRDGAYAEGEVRVPSPPLNQSFFLFLHSPIWILLLFFVRILIFF